ncbi:lipid A deacylase LpxR family protein [Parapedobacter sp. ISTM3]|uniref:lipid A deacylase LpxR family protein n=1 Tax=Parapedobacter sp. ISTM3 TaxID=2800130 RepID=UPI0021064E2B|nr:lipid A deacylase LpxR family protein [Parapedobacter sp. ISTM3]
MINSLYSRPKVYAVAVLFFVYTGGLAQHTPRSEFNFRNDNDLYLFNKQDQYYTNGVFFNIRKTVDSVSLSPNEVNRLWGITIGQKIYNAYTAHIRYIEEVDRPITAYLFLAVDIDRYFANESFVSLAGEVGTIGQRAFGRQLQEGIHNVLNLYEIAGWEYQLENAFGIDAAVQYGRLLYRNARQWFDLSAGAEAKLGLNHTGLSVAPTIRLGRLNPLHQSAYTSSRLQTKAKPVGDELFFYYSPLLNFVGYNATLQGGMFLRDKGPVTHDPARWVWYNQFGVMYARSALTLRLHYIFYTKEVPGMFFRHRYGSVGMSYRF